MSANGVNSIKITQLRKRLQKCIENYYTNDRKLLEHFKNNPKNNSSNIFLSQFSEDTLKLIGEKIGYRSIGRLLHEIDYQGFSSKTIIDFSNLCHRIEEISEMRKIKDSYVNSRNKESKDPLTDSILINDFTQTLINLKGVNSHSLKEQVIILISEQENHHQLTPNTHNALREYIKSLSVFHKLIHLWYNSKIQKGAVIAASILLLFVLGIAAIPKNEVPDLNKTQGIILDTKVRTNGNTHIIFTEPLLKRNAQDSLIFTITKGQHRTKLIGTLTDRSYVGHRIQAFVTTIKKHKQIDRDTIDEDGSWELEKVFLYGQTHNYIHLEITDPKTNEKIVSETINAWRK